MMKQRTLPAAILSFAILFLISIPNTVKGQEHDSWLGPDKTLHFGATFTISTLGYISGIRISDSFWHQAGLSVGLGLGAGISKEVYDLVKKNQWSWKDMAWNCIGTLSGLAITTLIHCLFWNCRGSDSSWETAKGDECCLPLLVHHFDSLAILELWLEQV